VVYATDDLGLHLAFGDAVRWCDVARVGAWCCMRAMTTRTVVPAGTMVATPVVADESLEHLTDVAPCQLPVHQRR
jgi:hypothetical protein